MDAILHTLLPLHKLFHHCRLVVREEEAVPNVEGGDLLHLVVGQGKIEDVDVLLHTLLVRALRDDDYAALDEEAQNRLCRRLAVRLAYLGEHLVVEEVVQALGKRTPRHDVAAILLHVSQRLHLLVEHMRLHLVDGRLNLDMQRKV